MLKQLALSCAILAAAALAFPQEVSFSRTFKLWEKDTYAVSVEVKGLTLLSTKVYEVTKLFDDGTADVTITTSIVSMKRGDELVPVPASFHEPVSVRHMNKLGATLAVNNKSTAGSNSFENEGMTLSRPKLYVGESVPIDMTDRNSKSRTKGAIVLLDVADGVAHLELNIDETKDGVQARHIEGRYSFGPDARLLKADYMVTSPDSVVHLVAVLQNR